jgi:hypothetical protein
MSVTGTLTANSGASDPKASRQNWLQGVLQAIFSDEPFLLAATLLYPLFCGW